MNIAIEDSEKSKQVSLFDFIPFNYESMDKFLSYVEGLTAKNEKLSKAMFYHKNNEGKTFIDVLINMGTPVTREERHTRVYLINSFFKNVVDLKSLDFKSFLMEEFSSFIQKSYENMCQKNNLPILNLDDYATQIWEINQSSHYAKEAIAKINPILESYFNNFPARTAISAYSLENHDVATIVASCALLNKVASNVAECENNKEFIADFVRLYDSKLVNKYYTRGLKKFVEDLASDTLPLNFDTLLLTHTDERGLREQEDIRVTESIFFSVMTEVVKSILLANSAVDNYETLNVNIDSGKDSQNRLAA